MGEQLSLVTPHSLLSKEKTRLEVYMYVLRAGGGCRPKIMQSSGRGSVQKKKKKDGGGITVIHSHNL